MIILDTNVIFELVRATPDPDVRTWVNSRPSTQVATTVITAAELHYGVARLPAGRRRQQLAVAVSALLNDALRGRVMPFDERAGRRYADVVTGREHAGRPIGVADAQIAAICRELGAVLATRNTKDFEETGIELIDPWQADPAPGPVGD
ncbi:MAG: type II toxin-antitoxin system VapC family toxin [Trebonia sp.]